MTTHARTLLAVEPRIWTTEERDGFLAWFGPHRWTQFCEARDSVGNDVPYHHSDATRFDITGALCRYFTWSVACELFERLALHCRRQKRFNKCWDKAMKGMGELQQFNDTSGWETIAERLHSAPVRRTYSRLELMEMLT